MKKKIVNPDLLKERANRKFDAQEITKLLIPQETLEFWKPYVEDLKNYPELRSTHKFYDMTRAEQAEDWWKKCNIMKSISQKRYFGDLRSGWACPHFFHPGNSPLLLNHGMFTSGLEKLGTDEQSAKWLEDFNYMRIHGCYAQTEIGHGSNVQGLETTATLDKTTDEWVLHTPTISATKYWPGELGWTATHAIVFAQAVVDGKK